MMWRRNAASKNVASNNVTSRDAAIRAARFLIAACVALSAAGPVARADVRVRFRDSAGVGAEITLYIKGSLQRRDIKSLGPKDRGYSVTYVNDCARQQFIWIDNVNRRYWAESGGLPAAVFTAFDEQQFPPHTPPKLKGTLAETIAVTDTGERREMFGFTARHLKTVTTWSSSERDSCPVGGARIETDGWYVDLLHGVDCSPDLSGAMPRLIGVTSACLGKRLLGGRLAFRREYAGEARPGFPVFETTRAYDERKLVWDFRREVIELSTDALDDALFAVPAGYARVEPREARKASALSRALSIFR